MLTDSERLELERLRAKEEVRKELEEATKKAVSAYLWAEVIIAFIGVFVLIWLWGELDQASKDYTEAATAAYGIR